MMVEEKVLSFYCIMSITLLYQNFHILHFMEIELDISKYGVQHAHPVKCILVYMSTL